MSSLYERNREAFQRHYPIVWRFLESLGEPKSAPVAGEDGRPVNIDLGRASLYPEAAPALSEKQVAAYFEDPDRIGFRTPAHCNLSRVSKRVLADMVDWFDANYGRELEAYPVVDVGFAFVFGIGLGYHVPDLVAQGTARYMVLIEPIPEFLLHSLSAVDWQAAFDAAAEHGTQIEFLLGKTPAEAMYHLEKYLLQKRQTFLDGSHAYMHYFSWELRELRRLLNEKIKMFYISWGYFEDELLMMRNTYHNLLRWDLGLIARKQHRRQTVPVFVVGSGPSLDNDLPVIEKYQDRAIIFSCGTSIGILRKRGIRVDFHNENENTWPLVENLRRFHAELDFEGTTLIASTTVPPEVGEFFDSRWYYHRAQLSSSYLLNGDIQPVEGTGPMVANAAFAISAAMGFREVYLFGVDCGRHPERGHHARDAVYYQEDYDNYLPGEGPELLETEFTREVPGNFGGTALTTWYLDLSRAGFAATLRLFPDCALYNCSDGARIDGAQPRHSASIRLTSQPGDVARAKQVLAEQIPHYPAGAFLDTLDLEALLDDYRRFPADFNAALDAALAEDTSFWELEQRMAPFINAHTSPWRAVSRMLRGTLASLIRLGAFGGTRIADADERLRFFRYFIEKYRETGLWMAAEAETQLREMIARRPELSEVGWVPLPGEADEGADEAEEAET